MDMNKQFVRGVIFLGLVATVAFGLEFLVEWVALGRPGFEDMSWAGTQNQKLVDVLSPMARAYNNILAMLLATIGLAIPLTANMHTPKLIDMFLRDPTNKFILGFCAIGAANVLFVDYLVGPKFAPLWAYRLCVLGAIIGWVLLVPYFFYVVRFLDPSNILVRLQNSIARLVEQVEKNGITSDTHEQIHEPLQQIGTIILKSIDRADRGVVAEGIWTLKRVLDHYGQRKPRMPAAWFQVDRKDFIGLSAEALRVVNSNKTWFEHKVLTQLYLAYQSALAKTTDAISSLSDATRVIAEHASQRGDEHALILAVKFFNNYLREAIKRKDIHAVYDVFYQYRLLAYDVRNRPAMVREICKRFLTYSEYGLVFGMPFVHQMVGFDLGWVIRRAYDCKSPIAGELLEDILTLKHRLGTEFEPMPIKAKLILGGYFQSHGLDVEADKLRRNMADVPDAVLEAVCKDLLALREPTFWEVTDRQLNFEWIDEEKRPSVLAFADTVRQAHAEATAGAAAVASVPK